MEEEWAWLMELPARLTSGPAWRRAQAEKEDRLCREFAKRLLGWDGESGELPAAGSEGSLGRG